MPLPSDMEKCMHKTKKEYGSHGRSKEPMGTKKAHKQRVAMCLKASGKSKKEGYMLTFKDFLVEITEA